MNAPLAALARLFVAAVLSTLGLMSSAAGGSTSSGAHPSVMTCGGTTVVKPKAYTIACADANSYLVKLHWTVWVSGGARATGILSENTCTPSCAAGTFVSHAAKVSLSGAKTTAHGYLYTRLTLSYRDHAKLVRFSTTLPTNPL